MSKILDEETGTAYFVSIEHDVTEETEKEQKIQSLMASMDQMSEAVAVVDTNGRGLYANKAFLRLTGLEQDRVVGFPMMDLTATSDHDRPMSEVLKEAMQRGWHGDASFLRKDGSRHLVSVEATPVKDTDGAPLGVVAIFRDVTKDRSEKVEFEKYKTKLEERMEQRTTELAKRVSQLTTINKISRVVTSLLDPDELMSEFVKSIAQGFEFDHVVIMLMDKDRGELYFKTGVGVDRRVRSGRPASEAQGGHRRPRRVLLGDARDWRRPVRPEVHRQSPRGHAVRAGRPDHVQGRGPGRSRHPEQQARRLHEERCADHRDGGGHTRHGTDERQDLLRVQGAGVRVVGAR